MLKRIDINDIKFWKIYISQNTKMFVLANNKFFNVVISSRHRFRGLHRHFSLHWDSPSTYYRRYRRQQSSLICRTGHTLGLMNPKRIDVYFDLNKHSGTYHHIELIKVQLCFSLNSN